jgi:hypothetical protein
LQEEQRRHTPLMTMEKTIDPRTHDVHAGRPAGGALPRWLRERTLTVALGAPTAWLVATAACVALAFVVLGRSTTSDVSQPSPIAARAPASDVERAFSGMTPFSVQPHMGASSGKDATCSFYSDGNLDTGARVTWAVTLCTVHSTGAGPAG